MACCKVLLSDAKVEILLFSWRFLVFLFMCHSLPSPLPSLIYTLIFRQTEGIEVVYIWAIYL